MPELERFAVDPVLVGGVVVGLALCLVYLVRTAPRERGLADAIRLIIATVGVAVGGRIMHMALFDTALALGDTERIYLSLGGFSALWVSAGDIKKTLRL
jgi:hypothetical protein